MAEHGQNIQETMSLCPACLKPLAAQIMQDGNETVMVKECPQHGSFSSTIWRGEPEFRSWYRPKIPYTGGIRNGSRDGCPYDCGLCEHHSQRTCTALVEVTSGCNLNCPVCFADSGGEADEPDLAQLKTVFKNVMGKTGGCNLQLSGGEPTIRDDLPEIVALAVQCGFEFVQLNSNGLRLAKDRNFCQKLADAGLSSVFLQFDGLDDTVYKELRGRELLAVKMRAIENLSETGVGIVLVPTLKPGQNMDQLWDIVQFGLSRQPHVRGVHFQPMSYFGRFPSDFQPLHITLPEIMTGLENQSLGQIKATDFRPPGCEHALCSFSAKFIQQDGKLTRLGASTCDCSPQPALQGAIKSIAQTAKQWGPMNNEYAGAEDELGQFIHRARNSAFSISAMAFQDCWNINLERLRGCCIHVAGEGGTLIPFCAYNLTSRTGRSIYRPQRLEKGIKKHGLEEELATKMDLSNPWTRQELERKQLEILKVQLRQAVKSNGFYKQKYNNVDLDRISALKDLEQLPFTSGEEIKENPYALLSISQSRVEHIITMASSGSTGKAKRFFFSAKDVSNTRDFFAKGMRNLIGDSDKVLILLPGELEASVGRLLQEALEGQGIEARCLWPPEQAAGVVQEHQFTCVVGLPPHLLSLSEDPGVFGQIRTMLLCSDYASPHLRRRVEENCGCETFLHYGSTETGLGGAVECGAHDGCHLREDELLVEIIDPVTRKQVEDGQVGEIVISTLNREAMPLFRYRTGDLATMERDLCSCGAKTARLKNIQGRISRTTLGGCRLTGHLVDDALFEIEGLLDYRLFLKENHFGNDPVTIDVHYLSSNNVTELTNQVKQSLQTVPVIKNALKKHLGEIGTITRKMEFSPDHRYKRTIIEIR